MASNERLRPGSVAAGSEVSREDGAGEIYGLDGPGLPVYSIGGRLVGARPGTPIDPAGNPSVGPANFGWYASDDEDVIAKLFRV